MKFAMGCSEKRSSLVPYAITAAIYSHAVREMPSDPGVVSRRAFEDFRKVAEDARVQCQRARIELEEHVWFHKC